MTLFLMIVLVLLVTGLGMLVFKQKSRMDHLERRLAEKKDDVVPYLALLGQIPAENLNEFVRNPKEVAHALGMIVEEQATAQYNRELVKLHLVAARRAREEEAASAAKYGLEDSDVEECRKVAQYHETSAANIERNQRHQY